MDLAQKGTFSPTGYTGIPKMKLVAKRRKPVTKWISINVTVIATKRRVQ